MIKNFIKLLAVLFPVMLLAQSPGGVGGNLQLWLPAENYTGGTTWNDASINARHATKTGTVTNTTMYNFYNVPTGLTNANYFSVPDNLLLNPNDGAISVFAVGLPGSGTYSTFIAKTSNSAWDSGWILATSDPMTDVGFTTGNWTGVGTDNVARQSNFSSAIPYLVSGFGNGAATNVVSISNNASVETTNTSAKTISNTALTIGWDRYSAAQGFKGGSIAEVVMFNRNLTAAEKIQVQTYLAVKYGITLSQTVAQSYVASDGVTRPWNHAVTEASTYNKNIFGIGRDTGSTLYQKQSKSINADQKLIIGAGNSLTNTNAANTNTLTNGQFLMVGDNGLMQRLHTPLAHIAPGGEVNHRFESIWKVQNTGLVGQVTIAWPKGISNLHLVRSTDATFNSSDTFIPMTTEVTINGVVYNTATVTFNNGDYFTFAGYVHAPGGVVNALSYWYRADKNTTNTGVDTDVTSWTDFYFGSTIASQLGTSALPKYAIGSTDYFNFNPGINFTADNQRLANVSVATLSSLNFDIFTFVKEGASTGNQNRVVNVGYNNSATGGGNWDSPGIAANGYVTRRTNIGGGSFGPWRPGNAPSTIIPSITYNTFTNTNFARAINGEANSAVQTNNAIGQTNGGFIFGDNRSAPYSGDDPGFIGHLGEVVIYGAGNLTATERRRVDSYLAIKYGITLDRVATENYLGSNAGIVWNGSDNSGYNNNIFGITHDELSALHQKQSKSVNPNQKLIIGTGSSLANTNEANTNSLTNGQFLLVGDNGLIQRLHTPLAYIAPGGEINNRFQSIWKVQNTGGTGQIIVAWPKGITNLHLVRSVGNDTFDTSDTFIPMTTEVTVNGVVYNTATVTFTNGDYFTFAGYEYAPGGVSSAAWYRADAGSTLFSDAGTTVAADNATIQQWNEFNSKPYPLSQATVAYRPQYSSATTLTNFNPTVNYDGTQKWLQYSPSNSDGYVIDRSRGALFSAGSTTSDAPFVGFGVTGAGNAMDDPGLYRYNAGRLLLYPIIGEYDPQSTYLINGPFIGGGTWENGAGTGGNNAVNITLDGYHQIYNTNITNVNLATDRNALMVGKADAGAQLTGQQNEMIIFPNKLTDQEVNRVESYLAVKYGKTLSKEQNRNYLSSANTVIWDGTVNNLYYNNVLGIGRDNVSALHQKQSKSVNANQKLIIGAGNSLANTNAANTNSLTNGQFLIVGDNNLTQRLHTALIHNAPGGEVNNRFEAIWKVQNTGSTGQVIVAWPKGVSNLHLVRSVGNSTFDVSDTFIPMTAEATINGIVYNTATVTFTDGDYFTFAGYIHAPGGVSAGLSAWHRADSHVYSDLGTTSATSGQAIQQWDDFNNSGMNFTQATVARRPTFTPDVILNFNPTVRFTRANTNWMDYTFPTSTAKTQGTMYFATKQAAAGIGAGVLGMGDNMNYPGWHSMATNKYLIYHMNFTPELTNNIDITIPNILGSSWRNGAGSTASNMLFDTHYNGFQQSFNTVSNISTTTNSYRIGQDTDYGAYDGNIGETVYYNVDLTTNEKNRVDSYLAIKYGVTLRSSNFTTGTFNYLSSGSATVWDGTVNATYHHNVFGIARDHTSALYQKQSKSMNVSQNLIIGAGSSLFNTNAANTNTLTNNQFLMVGDNGLTQSLLTPLVHPTAPGGGINRRFGAIWKVQNTNTVGQVIVAWPKGITNLHLVQSPDDAFDTSDTFIPMTAETTINGTIYNTATVTLGNGQFFTFAGFAIGPGGVDNVALWYDPLYGVTEASGVLTDWLNRGSFTGTTLTNATAANRPAFSVPTTGSNFNPFVTIAAGRSMKTVDGAIPTGLSNHTTFLASRMNSGGSSIAANMIYFANNSDDSFHDFGLGAIANGTQAKFHYWSNGGTRDVTHTTVPLLTTQTSLIGSRIRPDSPRKDISAMGNSVSYAHTGTFEIDNTFNIGDRGAYGNEGTINEVIFYSRALTDVERDQVDTYLAVKWGMTLRQPKNYLSSTGANVWNSATATAYNNNIFGIARDDAGVLHQRVSNSINTNTILTVAKNNDFTSSNLAGTRTGLPNDNAYLMFGDNNNTATPLTTPAEIGDCGELLGSETDIKLIQRKWMVQRTNNVGVTYLQANLTSYASVLNSDVYMFIADDANFTQNVVMVSGTRTGNNWAFAHNFDNENAVRYITIGGTYTATPCEQCKGGTYTLRTGHQWNQGLWANQIANQKLNIALGNDANGTPLTANMYADYSENPSIEYVPTRYPQQYGGRWTIARRYDNTNAKDRHRIELSQAMKASFQISNINTYLNNKNNFEVVGYCNGSVVIPKITFAYNTSYHTFTINGNQATGTMSWRGFIPNVSTANVRFDRPVDEIVIISAVERVNTNKTLRSSLYGDITLECAAVVEPTPDNVYVSHSYTQDTLATCGGETTMRIKVTNNNICDDKTISLHQLLPAGLEYVAGSFNGNDLPAGAMDAATLTYSGNSLELSGLTLPRGEHWMYVDVANPGTAGTHPTQFTFEVTNGINPAHTYSSSVVNLNYYESLLPSPAAPSLELSIKDNVSCGNNNDEVTYRMKIDNPNTGGINGAEILHMFDYDQTIQSVVFVSGEDENGVITGNYPVDGSSTPITPVGSSLFNLIDAVIPEGVSYIDITVNVGNSYDIAEVQALGISSSFLVGFGNGECAESGESVSNEVNLQICNACVKPGATGTPLTSSVGILTKEETSVTNWPESVPNGYLVLDGAFKGMVITHMTTAQINALTPVEGMLVFDTDMNCVKLYRGAGANAPVVHPMRQGWVCIQRVCID